MLCDWDEHRDYREKQIDPRWAHLRAPVTAVYRVTASVYWLTASGSPAQENSKGESNAVSALKTEMQKMQSDYDAQVQKMQKQYEDRISAMEAEMKALESKSHSDSILNTRIITDADGKGVE